MRDGLAPGDPGLKGLIGAITTADESAVHQLLPEYPELALERVAVGATRG